MSRFAPAGDPNIPDFEEADASPISVSGQRSVTINPSSPDMLLVLVSSFLNTSGADQDLQIRVHGETGGYSWTDSGGSTTTSAAAWPIGVAEPDGWGVSGTLHLYDGSNEDFSEFLKMSWDGTPEFGSEPAARGKIQPDGDGGALDSVTFRGSSGSISLDAEVFGWSR